MVDLELENDEGIILEKYYACINTKTVNVYLTHKNIIVTREYGVFKSKWEITKYPLNTLKVINGDAQATLINYPYTYMIRLMFLDKILEIHFQYSKNKKEIEKETKNWINQIHTLLTNKTPYPNKSETEKSKETKQTNADVKTPKDNRPEMDSVKRFCTNCGKELVVKPGSTIFCTNCGKKYTI